MTDVYELYTIKSKDRDTQKKILDELTALCLKSNGIDLFRIIEKDGVIDLRDESPKDIIMLCLLSIYASDIATVMYDKSRALHLNYLKEIVEEYGLPYNKVIYLAKYADEFFNEISQQ